MLNKTLETPTGAGVCHLPHTIAGGIVGKGGSDASVWGR